MIAPPGQRPPGSTEAEALFAEARRRRRRRRLAGGAACLLLAGLAATALVTAWPRHGAVIPGGPAARRAPGITLPLARVAWVDYGGQLHLGNLATRAQHVVTTVDASPADPLIQAGGHLYWADTSKNDAPIRDYDIATGRVQYLPRGDSVFASADGHDVYIVQTPTRLIELAAAGVSRPRRLTLPAGWHMSGGLGNWSVAGGIVVYSGPAGHRRPVTLAVWTPGTRHLEIIGRGLDITATFTARDASYSLLAWTAHGEFGITNTSTLASRAVRSPYRYGFTYGGLFSSGAFSPDGRHLAVFLNTTSPQDPHITPYSALAIVNSRTGALRLVRGAHLVTTEDVGWARWLPGGKQLIAGAESGSFMVDAVRLTARPFSFSGSPGQDIENSGDVNFSATILPSS